VQPTGNRRIAAAVLAAGAGSRLGMPKADVVVDGERLLDRAIAVANASECRPVLAVVRAGTLAAGARIVVNPDPERGQRSSLELALVAAGDVDALAVLLVDTPEVTAAGLRAVATAWTPGRVAVARYAAVRGHPIVMAPELWRAALQQAGPDEGARRFLAGHPELIDEIDVPGGYADLDTSDDLERWGG
jgi:molybdenum cofactor cytidylyltransferase/nicotine blue oxidoreductase